MLKNFVIKYKKFMPFEVYPLIGSVSFGCLMGIYMCFRNIRKPDIHLIKNRPM